MAKRKTDLLIYLRPIFEPVLKQTPYPECLGLPGLGRGSSLLKG